MLANKKMYFLEVNQKITDKPALLYSVYDLIINKNKKNNRSISFCL